MPTLSRAGSGLTRALPILLLAAAAPLAAQVPDSARPDSLIYELDAVQVQVYRPLATVGGTSAVEVRVEALPVPVAPTLDEVMREIPMLRVRTNSRGESEVLARGSESRQVAVLLDGIPLTLTWDARADVSVLPASAPQEVRFYRGLSTMLHGPNALGGVVELVTAGEHMLAPRAARFQTGMDATGGLAGAGSVTLPWESGSGDWLVRAGGGFRDSPGAPLARGVIEPLPGGRSLRLNTDARSLDAFGAVRYRSLAGPWISGSAMSMRAERGIAAELDTEAPRFWRYPDVRRSVAIVSGGSGFHDTPFGRGDVEASIGYDVGRTEILAFHDRTYATQTSFENGDDRAFTVRLLGDHTLGARGDLSVAWTRAEIFHDEILPSGSLRYRQLLRSFGVETGWRLGEAIGPLRDLRLSLGAARDAGETPESGDKPALGRLTDSGARAGLSARLGDGATSAHLGISRRGRFPALRESYSGAINRFEPNPDLGPERLTALEGGLTTLVGTGQLQVVGFHHRLDDAIVRVTLPNRKFMRVNEDEMRTTGVELLGALPLGGLTVGGDLALQRTEIVSRERAGIRPENQPALFGGGYAAVPLPRGVRSRVEGRYTGAQYCLEPSGAERRLDGGAQWNADLSRAWRVRGSGGLLSRLEARLSVDNLTDRAIYDQCGLPQPGRLARVQLRLF